MTGSWWNEKVKAVVKYFRFGKPGMSSNCRNTQSILHRTDAVMPMMVMWKHMMEMMVIMMRDRVMMMVSSTTTVAIHW